ncbi:MAG TPA: hypothetical protein VEI01_26200 [Terriglobales bacterium]|nr:hypothetical protein [Terriglobales bacterium]
MGRLLVIDALGASLLLTLWYLAFARYNHRKGAAALRWVQLACRGGRGKVVESRWFGSSRLQARLQFASRRFDNARLTVNLRPRALPLRWLFSYWRKQKETLTFEADLDFPPGFQLEVFNHRWECGKRRDELSSKAWEFHSPGPVVLTTRAKWTQDLSPVVSALMSSREHSFLRVQFRPESPNFSATVALEAMQDPDAASGFLTVLRELAAGASAKHL